MKLARIVLDQLRQLVLYITPSKLEKFLLESRDGYNGIPHEYSFPHDICQICSNYGHAAQICSSKSAFDVGGCAFWRRFAYRFGMRDGGFGLQMGFDAGLEVVSTSFI